MPSYLYRALDNGGQTVTGEIESPGRAEAIARLADKKIFVTKIDSAKPDPQEKASASVRMPWRRGVSYRMRAAMLRQLATALKAGLPLLAAMRVVEEQAENHALKSLMSDLSERVQSGESLSKAMAAHPHEFSRLEVSMVRVVFDVQNSQRLVVHFSTSSRSADSVLGDTVKQKVEPSPSPSDSTQIRPPCTSTIRLTSAKPTPEPSVFGWSLSKRLKILS